MERVSEVMASAYYNEFDPEKAHMLRQLIADGHVAPGEVDERSVRDVHPDDLKGFVQCHFFAGIGGWSVALRLAGWPDNRPVWTGSCPCTPYSIIGKRQAAADDRDLWPAWNGLIEPETPVIFGEQVADAIALGWYDRLADDMAAKNKPCWACVLPSCSTGQGNKGERLFFVAEADTSGLEGHTRNDREVIERALSTRYFATPDICDFIEGWDGLKRPVKSGVSLLVDGVSAGVLRKYSEAIGDSINPQLAAEFIAASEGWKSQNNFGGINQ